MLKTEFKLYDFQEEAVQRMTDRQQLLLALVMGAGKTISSIAAIEELLDDESIQRALIIVPANLKYQWQGEIHRFTHRHALVIDGSPTQRAVQYDAAPNYYYVITNYEAVVNDWQTVRRMEWDAIVLDEASYIKSFTAKRSKRVKSLGKKVQYRYALTGQPIENKPEDLYSIMQFVDDSVLGEFAMFDRTFIVRNNYGKPIRHRNLPLLKNRMADAMVRKTRADLKGQLPDVVEKVIEVRLSRPEARLYNLIKDQLLLKMYDAMNTFGSSFSLEANYGMGDQQGAMMKAQGEIMTMLLALRQVCGDARMLKTSALNYKKRKLLDDGSVGPGAGSAYAAQLLDAGVLERLPKSTKVNEYHQLLEELYGQGEQKLVTFSTFKEAIDIMRGETPVQSVIYTGDMNARQKETAKLQFKNDPETKLFISSDAGGYGVDLPMANYLISFDLPWSTGKFEQRESRIIRLSSEFEYVTLIAMVVLGSVEMRMHGMLSEKKGVADAYLDGGYDRRGRFEMTLSSLTQFLMENEV